MIYFRKEYDYFCKNTEMMKKLSIFLILYLFAFNFAVPLHSAMHTHDEQAQALAAADSSSIGAQGLQDISDCEACIGCCHSSTVFAVDTRFDNTFQPAHKHIFTSQKYHSGYAHKLERPPAKI